jgi:hypothetical protein
VQHTARLLLCGKGGSGEGAEYRQGDKYTFHKNLFNTAFWTTILAVLFSALGNFRITTSIIPKLQFWERLDCPPWAASAGGGSLVPLAFGGTH